MFEKVSSFGIWGLDFFEWWALGQGGVGEE